MHIKQPSNRVSILGFQMLANIFMLRKETRNYARITSRDYCQREDAYIISLEGANHKQVR